MVTAISERQPDARPYLALGQRIAALRQRRGLSQRELAREAHISEGYVPRIERGLNRPDPDVLRSLAAALGTVYDELAPLAGYLTLRTDEAIFPRTEDQVAPLRRLLRFPGWVLDRLDRAGDALFYVDVEPPRVARQGEPEAERDADDDPDTPDVGASGGR